mmetsp:Transcript_20633/g.57820  ORF Transcript_20633/g.57820 Transcript_20633/m.57820 type:complete len:301 (+) Transcript_20633:463-1365(+)
MLRGLVEQPGKVKHLLQRNQWPNISLVSYELMLQKVARTHRRALCVRLEARGEKVEEGPRVAAVEKEVRRGRQVAHVDFPSHVATGVPRRGGTAAGAGSGSVLPAQLELQQCTRVGGNRTQRGTWTARCAGAKFACIGDGVEEDVQAAESRHQEQQSQVEDVHCCRLFHPTSGLMAGTTAAAGIAGGHVRPGGPQRGVEGHGPDLASLQPLLEPEGQPRAAASAEEHLRGLEAPVDQRRARRVEGRERLQDRLRDPAHRLLRQAPAGPDELVQGPERHVLTKDTHRVTLRRVPEGLADAN